MEEAERLDELLAGAGTLDRVLAVVASVDDEPPTEDEVVAAFDRIAASCPTPEGPDRVEVVLAHVFGAEGFVGDRTDYHDPANSLIHRVLARRRGIPLSLAAVAAEVGRRHGVDLRPVGLPGHVLLGEGASPDRWWDPFAAGAPLDLDDCRRIFARFQPEAGFRTEFLAPMSAEEVAVRTLNNLRNAHARSGEPTRIIPVLELRAAMASAGPADRLELARLLVLTGRFGPAAEQFDRLAELDPARAADHRAQARALRARWN